VVLIRNNDITSLSPITPPLSSLFDPLTGQLLGQQIALDFEYVSYSEPLVTSGDSRLVLYQIADADQTLFLTALENGQVAFNSFGGSCRQIDSVGLSALVNRLPALYVEFSHAEQLYGVGAFASAVVCEDSNEVLAVATVPVQVSTDSWVGLTYLRDGSDLPRAFITITSTDAFSLFSLDGGLRRDESDPQNPVFLVLDSGGQVASGTSVVASITGCEQAAIDYNACLATDAFWRSQANHLATAFFGLGTLSCGPLLVSGYAVVGCVVGEGLGFATKFYALGSSNCTVEMPPGGLTCDAPLATSPECVATPVCHLAPLPGHPFCTFPASGPCTNLLACGATGPGFCDPDESGVCKPVEGPELCDARDNDCNGVVDTFPTACGVGACAAAGTCVNGTDFCTPGNPAPGDATCNGIDDDCTGAVDEDYTATPTTCGVGACAATGQLLCTNGTLADTCAPAVPSQEVCDGTDNDCDGTIDEGCSAQCLQLGGAGWVEVPDSPSLDVEGDITIEFWARIDSSAAYFPAVTKWQDGGFNNRAYFVAARDHPAFQNRPRFSWSPAGGDYSDLIGPTAIAPAEWHHFAAVRNGVSMLLYIDGVLVASAATVPDQMFDSPEPLRIGRGLLYNTDVRAIGLIDEVRVWNVARSQTDIEANQSGLLLPQGGLVGYWTFNESAGDAFDYSANGNHGILVGDAVRVPCAHP